MKSLDELKKILLLMLSVILMASGGINLKNYSGIISLYDLTIESFFLPVFWMMLTAIGGHLFVRYIKKQASSQ